MHLLMPETKYKGQSTYSQVALLMFTGHLGGNHDLPVLGGTGYGMPATRPQLSTVTPQSGGEGFIGARWEGQSELSRQAQPSDFTLW